MEYSFLEYPLYGLCGAGGCGEPFLAYKHINVMTDLGEQAKKRFEEIYGRKFDSTDELLAYDIAEKLGETYGFSEEYLLDILKNTATAPEKCDYVMDHG